HRVKPVKNDDLVDYVKHDCEEEEAAYILPHLPQEGSPVLRLPNQGPEEGRLALAGIPPSGPDGEGRRYDRLQAHAEVHRSAISGYEIVPPPREHFFHRVYSSKPTASANERKTATRHGQGGLCW